MTWFRHILINEGKIGIFKNDQLLAPKITQNLRSDGRVAKVQLTIFSENMQ